MPMASLSGDLEGDTRDRRVYLGIVSADHSHSVSHRKRHELVAPADEKQIGGDEEPVSLQLLEGSGGR